MLEIVCPKYCKSTFKKFAVIKFKINQNKRAVCFSTFNSVLCLQFKIMVI